MFVIGPLSDIAGRDVALNDYAARTMSVIGQMSDMVTAARLPHTTTP